MHVQDEPYEATEVPGESGGRGSTHEERDLPRAERNTWGLPHAITVGRVGDKKTRGVATIRVDRSSALGNPYHMRTPLVGAEAERDREAVCAAFEVLLSELHANHQRVEEIGRGKGVIGNIGKWNGVDAQRMLTRLRVIALQQPLRLDCHCAPLRCHAESIMRMLAFKLLRMQSL